MAQMRPSPVAKALVTGIAGQDGYYLAERLLELGYAVVGTSHRADASPTLRVGVHSVPVRRLDLGDPTAVDDIVRDERPDEIYNLAARASSAQLFDDPLASADINGVAVARLLESIRRHNPRARFCQASSREVFAGTDRAPQDESTPRTPISAYGAAKAFADHLVAAYRSTHGLFACSAVLYSHESPRRPPHFLVRKVTQAAARARRGDSDGVSLGDLGAVRDWGYAPDYVEAMRRMLQRPEPRDYVIATGVAHTVQDVCEVAFRQVGLDWRNHVRVDDKFKRPPDRVPALGNASRARAELDWRPTVDFERMIAQMVEADALTGA
jgi:GDPmannose 4,6-dehydratase